ncbi:MAG: trans-aconitate 2-methyltransferase [Hyphomicrobiales bacterium]|nr:trans-aconitate 2-methyltransferase [Hyphomicrobiales bacterium]
MEDWSARQYLKFEDERTRPPRDLLAQVPLPHPRRVVDLGCGPGNSTELLIARYPQAEVLGLDSSPDMLRKARERLPRCIFVQADIAAWLPPSGTDLLFANAALQWIPDHPQMMRRLLEALPGGGVLAVQMPDNTREPSHVLQREVAAEGPWADNPGLQAAPRADLPPPEVYYELLRPLCTRLDIWHTVYDHVLTSPQAIVEWFKGSALQPYLAPLNAEEREQFLAAYTRKIAAAYRPLADGKVMLKFPRLFIVAMR